MSLSVKIPITDGPKWIEHIEIENNGKVIRIQIVRGNGYMQAEAVIDSEEFFRLMEKLK